jgi:hypothetical protein
VGGLALAALAVLTACAHRQASPATPQAHLQPSSYMVFAEAYERDVTSDRRRTDIETVLKARLGGMLVGWAGYEADETGLDVPFGAPQFDWDRGSSGVVVPKGVAPGPKEGLRLVVWARLVASTDARTFWEWIGLVADMAVEIAGKVSNVGTWHVSWQGVDVRWALVRPDGTLELQGREEGKVADAEAVMLAAVAAMRSQGGLQ